ncbi:hypothetical protein H6F74_00975 [Trichocoleus sp. FACHB-90]|uniref:hypothetical protein n=1 Tax=Cyanophyceae TaxID=3028117 RepID=UPI0016820691|nr:hypothetical protein [Trichocoleus sp. FACHB-90]MBD1924861.1 hypothetical protein [Trichocoleus sp. FACHB-90]
MGVSKEFKEQLKAGKVVEALTLALSEAIELEITTWVSSANSDTPAGGDQPLPGHSMRTRINIVDGDIENEVGSEFLGNGSYAELREFHLEQVQEGREIIQENLANLQHLFTVLTNTLSQMQTSRLSSNSQPLFPPSTPNNPSE